MQTSFLFSFYIICFFFRVPTDFQDYERISSSKPQESPQFLLRVAINAPRASHEMGLYNYDSSEEVTHGQYK